VVPPGTQKTPDQAARNSQSAVFGHLSDILAILRGGHFFTLFLCFSLFWFSHFDDFWFSAFCLFSLFLIFMFFLFFDFVDFWSFFVIFLVCVDFWSFIVIKLGASMMTHFLSSKPALPLSPLLVVKFDHYLRCKMLIDFWSFFVIFWLNLSENDEKLDFAIKKHCFWHFFDTIFSQILIIFGSFFGSFLGFLGGYPSPSISAPLVVKKCLKLYIYI